MSRSEVVFDHENDRKEQLPVFSRDERHKANVMKYVNSEKLSGWKFYKGDNRYDSLWVEPIGEEVPRLMSAAECKVFMKNTKHEENVHFFTDQDVISELVTATAPYANRYRVWLDRVV